MKWNSANKHTRLYLISFVVLLVGLSVSILIYLEAANHPESDSDYEVIGGLVYPKNGNLKNYTHDLQLYGGKAALLSDRFIRWFAGLWHGESLAFIAAFITILISLAFFIAANKSPSRLRPDGHGENSRDGTG